MSKRTTEPATDRIERALRAAPTGLSLGDLRRAVRGRAEDFFDSLKSLRAAGHVRVYPEKRETPDGRLRGVLVHKWAPERTLPGSCEPQAGSIDADPTADTAYAAEAEFGDAEHRCPGCGAPVASGWCSSCCGRPGWHP